jgi:hypothetical protein
MEIHMFLGSFISRTLDRLKPKRKTGSDDPSQPVGNSATQPDQAAQKLADQLVGLLLPLWLKRHRLDLEVRFETGRALLEGLYPSGKERLPYGGQVMNDVGKALALSPPDLHRMVKFAREFKDLATFQAQHPGVTSWDRVKKILAGNKPVQAGSSKRKPIHPSKLFWKQFDKGLATLKAKLASVPAGSKKEDAEKRMSEFQAVQEQFSKLLSHGAVTSDK